MPNKKQPKQWIVTSSGDRPLHEVAADLKAADFEVHEMFEEIGSISGTADEDSAAKLKSIPGIADVSLDTPIDIGPPSSEETW